MDKIPVTETQKPMKRRLRRERWDAPDPVFWRSTKAESLRPLHEGDRNELLRRFEARGRVGALDAS
jgi:hypothetical protein